MSTLFTYPAERIVDTPLNLKEPESRGVDGAILMRQEPGDHKLRSKHAGERHPARSDHVCVRRKLDDRKLLACYERLQPHDGDEDQADWKVVRD
jgi:hypothetical protein